MTESVFTWYQPPTRPGDIGTCQPSGDEMCGSLLSATRPVAMHSRQGAQKGRANGADHDGHAGHPGHGTALFHIPAETQPNHFPELATIARAMNAAFGPLCADALRRKQDEMRRGNDPRADALGIMLYVTNEGPHLVYGLHEAGTEHPPIDLRNRIREIRDTAATARARGPDRSH